MNSVFLVLVLRRKNEKRWCVDSWSLLELPSRWFCLEYHNSSDEKIYWGISSQQKTRWNPMEPKRETERCPKVQENSWKLRRSASASDVMCSQSIVAPWQKCNGGWWVFFWFLKEIVKWMPYWNIGRWDEIKCSSIALLLCARRNTMRFIFSLKIICYMSLFYWIRFLVVHLISFIFQWINAAF